MTKIIGHRGVAGLALENTAEGIKVALALPIDGIEIDVRVTKDDQLVVLHDEHTGYVSDTRLWASESSLAELQKITLKNGEHLLSLERALDLIAGKKPVTIDVKGMGASGALGRILADYKKADITISSRQYAEIPKMHKLLPDVPFLVQSHLSPTDVVHTAHMLHADGISLNKWLMNPLIYRLARRTKLAIRVYTVNQPWLVRLFMKFYPEVAIYTDHPERFAHLSETSRKKS